MKLTPAIAITLLLLTSLSAAQGLGTESSWGRGVPPAGHNQVFASSDGCALCHSTTEQAIAMRGPTGEDISPFHLWQSSMMANSFKDPYWRAQVSKATHRHPERKAEIEKLCTTCHAPMASHTARIGGFEPLGVADLVKTPLAEDGVSCTVCHQARPDNFGKLESFNGRLDIRPGRQIFGPYPKPTAGPMKAFTNYIVGEGAHLKDSGLCGSCHTLETHHAVGAEGFQEQTPYLEWLNSDYAKGGKKEQSCQECHMPDFGNVRIARAPNRRDFNIPARPNYRGHTFYGGNAYMLDLLAANRDLLGIGARPEHLRQAAHATRKQLADSTASIEIINERVEDGKLKFSVKVENKTGHKLPSGYPSRRLWLAMVVRRGGEQLFVSGAYDESGRLSDVKDPLALPHENVITKESQIPVWETVVLDAKGKPTTELVSMAKYGKDNRLLPSGWKKDGPHAKKTAPVGIGDDKDFVAGSDTVHYEIDLKGNPARGIQMVGRLFYQTIPPAWALDLESTPTPEAQRFLKLYKEMPTTTEILALKVKTFGL